MSLFFICSFSFLIKKLQKRERTCRAYMKVLEQCFCPLCLLPSPPLFLCYCTVPALYRPKFSSMHPLHCHVLPPPCASCFFFSVIASHADTIVPKVLFLSQRGVISNLLRWLLYMDVSLCLFPHLYALTAMVYFVFRSVFPFCVF